MVGQRAFRVKTVDGGNEESNVMESNLTKAVEMARDFLGLNEISVIDARSQIDQIGSFEAYHDELFATIEPVML